MKLRQSLLNILIKVGPRSFELINYLKVFKSTPACRSFKEREEKPRPKQAKRENSSQYAHVKVELEFFVQSRADVVSLTG